MKCKWRMVTVQDLIDAQMIEEPKDGNHGNIHPKSTDYVTQGIPFIMANDLVNGRVDYQHCAYISEKQAQTLKKGFSHPGDILLTHKATIGRTAIVTDDYETIILTPQVTYYRTIKGILNRYLKYYFDCPYFQNILANWAGAGSTRAYLGITAQKKLPILLPALEAQNKIAKILSALDDKIELNNRINQNLEAQAQAIFDKNLADLSELPVGWSKGSLLDIADYLNGLAMQKFRPNVHEVGLPVLKIKELRQGMCDNDSEQCSPTIQKDYIVHDGDVVFSWSGSLLVDLWCGGVCGLNQHLFKVTSQKYSKWFYYFWTKYHLGRFIAIAAAKATTMGHIKREDLSNAEVIIPSKDDFIKFDNILSPLLNLMIKNRIENRRLSALRDTLLPKLMSGELDVSNVDI